MSNRCKEKQKSLSLDTHHIQESASTSTSHTNYKKCNYIITCRNKAAILIHHKSTKGQLPFKLQLSKHAFNSISHSIAMETPRWNRFHQPKSCCAHTLQEVEVSSFKISSFIPTLMSLGCFIHMKPYSLRLLQMKW